MILIFDLDDTLYQEKTFVKSGINEVAQFLSKKFNLDYGLIYEDLLAILSQHGRGEVFDIFLKNNNIFSKKLVRQCISKYRLHYPKIKLYPEALEFLKRCKFPLYLVTDGNKIVQGKKIEALGIEQYFEKIFITHNYGIKSAKPSLHCFEVIRKLEGCDWSKVWYVGDNPTKDFVSLNKVGANTVRLLMGAYETVEAPTDFDAKIKLTSWASLNEFFTRIEQ
jgi:putative hydrolase of the HAD superfamily